MNAEEFLKLAKSGSSSIPLVEVLVSTGDSVLKGSGVLLLSSGSFSLKFACVEGNPPEIPSVVHREHFWNITGCFLTGLGFKSTNVPPACSWRGLNAPKSCTFQLESIDLEAEGFDSLNYDEFEELIGRSDEAHVKQGLIPINRERSRNTGILHVTIANCPLLFGNEEIIQRTEHPFLGDAIRGIGRVLRGSLGKFEYCLSESDDELKIDIRNKNGELTSEREDRDFLQALLTTISFTHGQQPPLSQFQYWRDHKLVENQFRPARATARSSNIPFPERLCILGATKNVEFDFPSAFQQILGFFLKQDGAVPEITAYLSELRFASAEGMNPSHARLAVCRIFEGVVDVIFRELKLEQTENITKDVSAFARAKSEISEWLSKKEAPGFERLQHLVASAKSTTVPQKYAAIIQCFGFKSDGIAGEILSDWKARRHRLAHGCSDSGESNEAALGAWVAQSRIEGGINMLVLKVIGYSGLMRISRFQDTYVKIQ